MKESFNPNIDRTNFIDQESYPKNEFNDNYSSSNNLSNNKQLVNDKRNKEKTINQSQNFSVDEFVNHDNNLVKFSDEKCVIPRTTKEISPLIPKFGYNSSLDFLENTENIKFMKGESENSFKHQILQDKNFITKDSNIFNRNLNIGAFNSFFNIPYIGNSNNFSNLPNSININHNNFDFEMENKLNPVKSNSRLIIKEDNLVDEIYANKSSFRKFSDKKINSKNENVINLNELNIPHLLNNSRYPIDQSNIFNILSDDRRVSNSIDELIFRDNLLKTISNKKQNKLDIKPLTIK